VRVAAALAQLTASRTPARLLHPSSASGTTTRACRPSEVIAGRPRRHRRPRRSLAAAGHHRFDDAVRKSHHEGWTRSAWMSGTAPPSTSTASLLRPRPQLRPPGEAALQGLRRCRRPGFVPRLLRAQRTRTGRPEIRLTDSGRAHRSPWGIDVGTNCFSSESESYARKSPSPVALGRHEDRPARAPDQLSAWLATGSD